jgi:hypothetical protein
MMISASMPIEQGSGDWKKISLGRIQVEDGKFKLARDPRSARVTKASLLQV